MYGSRDQNSFESLMSMAKQNADEARKKVAKLETNRPKKADPRQVKLKEGVAKFLAKQAEDERRRKEEDKIKKEKLLQLRQQDRKATNRVRKMLSMTKSANKSCIEDARDCLNESVTAQTQQGEIQPDEDDYGYTSNYADMMHKKIMEKYKSIPVKPAFPQTSTVPVPKHQSLQKNGSGWRKSGSSQDYEDERGYSSPEQEREQPVSRKPDKPAKPHRPPPPDYRQLLLLAQEKQAEGPSLPIKPVVDPKGEKDEFEFGRPMTAKEKKAFLEQKEMKERLARRMEGKPADRNNNSNSNNESKPGKMPSFKIPRAKSGLDDSPAPSAPPAKKPKVTEPEPNKKEVTKEISKSSKYSEHGVGNNSSKSSSVPSSKSNGVRPMSNGSARPVEKFSKMNGSSSPAQLSKPKSDPRREKPAASSALPPLRVDPKSERIAKERHELIQEKPRYLSAFDGGRGERDRDRERDNQKKQPLNSNVANKPRPGSSRDTFSVRCDDDYKRNPAAKRPPPIDDRNRPPKGRDRDEVRSAPRRDMGPPPRRDVPEKSHSRMRDDGPSRMRPPGPKPSYRGRAVIDSDEEYDSEMDDFIDDSEVDMDTISTEISKIFGYDRRRYVYADESDDECMESSVAQQMLEEKRSLRIGIQEDLEDMAREEEEKKRQMMMKKKKKIR